ncbi:VanZ family protein [Aliifodinibius sp. S!AR15-10]|uniref:VanZ family protein n=1 Tax=Aliifodinibius sp. S!AR15-10 TaxID=2950437 RepID=UPI002859EBCC|nr:VanZ family protein [Aliifodinibius sp. S!AR15-10]MDR8392081.1 VanZ family protein [Aliifodinibius sp. S!AR15-10]
MIKLITGYLRSHPKLILLGLFGITISALLLTLIPADYLGHNEIWSYDKLGHFLLFGSWTFLLGLYSMVKDYKHTNLWKIFSLGVLFGGAIEILQHVLPVNRNGDILDFCVDALGAVGAVILLKFITHQSDK